MSMTGLEVFDATVQKTNVWLGEIKADLGCEQRPAYEALRGVLHALRDRLSVNEAFNLSAQLPMLVRGIFWEGYRPARKPDKARSRDEFLARIAAALPNLEFDPEDAAAAVFAVLSRHCDPGEIRHVVEALPMVIRAVWPNHEAMLQPEAATQ